MEQVLRRVLQAFVRNGALTVILASGRTFTCGDGRGRPVTMRFTRRTAQWGILLDPELRLGEAYMNGGIVIEDGSLADALAILMGQPAVLPHWARPRELLRYLMRHLNQFNPRRRARRNVAHHYNLDGRLYALFLDSDRQYSCAYFDRPQASLDDAQLAKKRHLAAKLLLTPGQRVLDIGSGWGGLALYMAEAAGAHVTGITLSEEQFRVARQRAVERRLDNRAAFHLEDYRDTAGCFDRIVSVGMFEHVGIDHYDRFFRKCAELLDENGVMVLHSIGRSERPSYTNPWIAKYIFPGGYIPALSEVLPAIERAGLLVTDIEILRLHYAETLKIWRERFLAHREQVERLYDARFVRMWEFYLACSEMAFRKQALMNFQIQLTRRQDVVPMTRDYLAREEARLRDRETVASPPLSLAGE
ncbi:MAG: class I SAM-dependent methyltransferase [Xanthobacteraceae bacterium]|nr:MAG: class I SAM-dependent methyltransferase [Xanthobacteraceae bacterium]